MKKIAIMLGAALAFGLVSAQDAAGTSFGDYDADASGDVTAEEFGTGFGTTAYAGFDADASGGVDQDEFTRGMFHLFDTNRDEALTQEEFDAGTTAFWGQQYAGTAFSDLDTEGTGQLTQDQFTAGFDATGVYNQFDADTDSQVTQDEFTQGMFGVADVNADDSLDQGEFDNASTVFGNAGTMGDAAGEGETDAD